MTEGSRDQPTRWLTGIGRVERPVAVELLRAVLALHRPHLTAYGAETERSVTLVRVTLLDGTVGWGECDALSRPGYADEHAEGAFAVLRDLLAPMVLRGEHPTQPGHPMAVAGIEGALLDAALRQSGTRLLDALGGGRDQVDCCAVVSAATVEDLLTVVEERVAEGYGAVSAKIRPGWAVEPVAAVRASWPDLAIAVDANGSFAEDSAELAELDRLGLSHIEQPLAAGDHDAEARLAGRLDTPVALDESISTADDVERMAATGAGRIVNVKAARVGGLTYTREVLDVATRLGLDAFGGGMLEAGVGRAHALAVAANTACRLPTHLGPSHHYFERDLTRSFELGTGATLTVPDGPGIGVVPDPEALDTAVTEVVRLT